MNLQNLDMFSLYNSFNKDMLKLFFTFQFSVLC